MASASWNETGISSGGFDPNNVDLNTADPREIICYLASAGGSESEHEVKLGTRISAIFVIFVVSTAANLFPLLATRIEWLRIPLHVYLLVRYFGAGVIIATAFIHLLDPAYSVIGPQTCVGMTGAWANFSWPPALAMTSAMCVFLLDFTVECHVQARYGMGIINLHGDVEGTVTRHADDLPDHQHQQTAETHQHEIQELPSSDDERDTELTISNQDNSGVIDTLKINTEVAYKSGRTFEEQIGAFLVLEFGVIFHSIIIGLNLGVASSEFRTLFPVLVFHQGFEGLGIGARLSTIPFPPRFRLLPWILCLAYGLTTPISVAVGISLRSSYAPESFTANVVSGVLDSISAGILLYTGFVELLARDFLFHPERCGDKYRVSFMICCLYLGIATMALLGKWA